MGRHNRDNSGISKRLNRQFRKHRCPLAEKSFSLSFLAFSVTRERIRQIEAKALRKLILPTTLIGCLVVAAITGTVVAGPVEDGEAAFERGEYAIAINIFQPLAIQGNSLAQIYLGDLYNSGCGVPENYTEALRWYHLAAEQDFANAKFKIGTMYNVGHGVPRDYAEAVKWYRLAAEQGDPRAQFNLGAMYSQGHGVPQDYAEAVKWYRTAAEQGDDTSQLSLGVAYAKGQGIPQDYVHAHMWFNLAAAQHDYGAAEEQRSKVDEKMTPAQIMQAQKLAREWKPNPQTQRSPKDWIFLNLCRPP